MIEIELKCELSPQLLKRVREKVRAMAFEGTTHNHDVYYDTPTWDLLRRAVFLRVRNQQQVEVKFSEESAPAHGLVKERVFPLHSSPSTGEQMHTLLAYFLPRWKSAPSFEEAIRANDLIEFVCIDNTREAYAGEHIRLSIDHVEGLGDFLEVETHCEEDANTGEAQARLQAFVSDLQVRHINVGYVELWLAKHNPAAYQVGKYHVA